MVDEPDAMSRAGTIIKRTLKSFYDDQMTHHAAALTYYSLMSLFPTGGEGALPGVAEACRAQACRRSRPPDRRA